MTRNMFRLGGIVTIFLDDFFYDLIVNNRESDYLSYVDFNSMNIKAN